MSSIKKLSPAKKAALTVAGVMILWVVASQILLAQPVSASLLFLAFQLGAVALPGFALVKLLRLRLSPLETFAAAYGLGVAALLVLYLYFAPLQVMGAIPWAVGALMAASAAALVFLRRVPLCGRPDTGEIKIALVFCMFAGIAAFMLSAMTTLTPDLSGARQYYHDTLNGVALTTSASRGFPMLILQMAGTAHWYHLFFFAYNAVMKLTLGLDSFTIVTKMSMVVAAPVIAALSVALAKRITKSNLLCWIAGALILVVPGYGGVHYLYKDTIGYPFGLAFGMLAVLFYLEARAHTEKAYNRYYALSAVFLLVCAGAKGPIGVTVLFALCFSLLLTLLRERRWSVLIQGLAYAVPFFALYFLLYRSGASDSMSWSFLYSGMRTPFGYWAVDHLPGWLAKTAIFIYSCVSQDLLVSIIVILMLVYMLRKTQQPNAFVDLCVGGVAIGWFLVCTFKQLGSSEIYFFMCIVPFCYIAGLYCLRALRSSLKKNAGVAFAAAAAVLAAPFLVNNGLNAYRYYKGEPGVVSNIGLTTAFEHSLFSPQITTEEQLAQLEAEGLRRNTITPQEYAAMIWIRDNTPPDAVFADGRYMNNNKYFCGTTFSERGFFLEGFGFVTMEDSNDNTPEKIRRDTFLRFFFQEPSEGYLPLMAREGCDYIIISEYVNPGLVLSERFCTEVFRNEHVTIYQLHEWEE